MVTSFIHTKGGGGLSHLIDRIMFEWGTEVHDTSFFSLTSPAHLKSVRKEKTKIPSVK